MPTKKGKKNFKDYTGVKFADLILPMVMGGVGSYSPAAGRGVSLGLNAFRTLQAGRAYQDEREEGEAMSQHFSQRLEDLQKEKGVIESGRTKEDVDEVERGGFYGEGGAAMPDPERRVGEGATEDIDLTKPDAFREEKELGGLGIDQLTPEQLGLGGEVPEEQQIGEGSFADAIPAPDYNEAKQYADKILEHKFQNEQASQKLGLIDNQIRFYETQVHLGRINPSSAGYLSGMNDLARMKNEEEIRARYDMHKLYTDLASQKHKNTLIEITQRRDDKEALMLMEQELNPYQYMNLGDGVIVQIREKDGAMAIHDKSGAKKVKDLKALTLPQKQAMMTQAVTTIFTIQEKINETGIGADSPELAKAMQAYNAIIDALSAEEMAAAREMVKQQTGKDLPTQAPPPPVDAGKEFEI